jgi:hypothetical protein
LSREAADLKGKSDRLGFNQMSIREMFDVDLAVLGVVSASDLYSKDIVEHVARDFDSLQRGGVDDILFENEG